MEKISVKAVEGRVAFTAPRGGVRIPSDQYIEVDRTGWIDRLLNVHGDIVQDKRSASKKQDETKKPTVADPAKS